MKNTKYLAWFYSDESMNKMMVGHSFLINKLCENFEKIYFINIKKIELPGDRDYHEEDFGYKVDTKFKLPDNIEFFIPRTKKNFEDFMIGKELIAINSFGRSFSELKVYRLLVKYRIKLIQIQNIGFFNTRQKNIKNLFWKNLFYRLNKASSHKLIVLLSNLGLVPKIQIRFTSSSEVIESINKSFIKKILYNLKFFYVKELVLINSCTYDVFKKTKIEIKEDQIVLLDTFFLNPDIVAFGANPSKEKIEKHYYFLNKLINNLSTMYKKKIVVCIHPKDNLKLKKKYFPNLDVVQYETRKNIYKAFLVLFIETSSIVDAILLKKRILTLFSNFFSKTINNFGQDFAARAGLLQINIENELKTDKNIFLSKLDKAKGGYSNYIKSFIAPDGSNIGCEKIIKILKERFF